MIDADCKKFIGNLDKEIINDYCKGNYSRLVNTANKLFDFLKWKNLLDYFTLKYDKRRYNDHFRECKDYRLEAKTYLNNSGKSNSFIIKISVGMNEADLHYLTEEYCFVLKAGSHECLTNDIAIIELFIDKFLIKKI